MYPQPTNVQGKALKDHIDCILSQLSKCLKFMTFRGVDVLSYTVECKYLREALETFYHHSFYKR